MPSSPGKELAAVLRDLNQPLARSRKEKNRHGQYECLACHVFFRAENRALMHLHSREHREHLADGDSHRLRERKARRQGRTEKSSGRTKRPRRATSDSGNTSESSRSRRSSDGSRVASSAGSSIAGTGDDADGSSMTSSPTNRRASAPSMITARTTATPNAEGSQVVGPANPGPISPQPVGPANSGPISLQPVGPANSGSSYPVGPVPPVVPIHVLPPMQGSQGSMIQATVTSYRDSLWEDVEIQPARRYELEQMDLDNHARQTATSCEAASMCFHVYEETALRKIREWRSRLVETTCKEKRRTASYCVKALAHLEIIRDLFVSHVRNLPVHDPRPHNQAINEHKAVKLAGCVAEINFFLERAYMVWEMDCERKANKEVKIVDLTGDEEQEESAMVVPTPTPEPKVPWYLTGTTLGPVDVSQMEPEAAFALFEAPGGGCPRS